MFLLLLACAHALVVPQSPKTQLREFFEGRSDVFVDPQTKEPLIATPRFVNRASVTYKTDSGATYASNDVYLDLVSPRTAPSLQKLREDVLRYVSPTDVVQVQTFRSPATAFLYERGWRDSFTRNGFPGPDAEFAEFKEFSLEPLQEGTIVDLSCGTGLFTRRIYDSLDSEKFRLIAADYSEAMLREAKRRLEKERDDLPELVRADVAALPFKDESIDAVHCGAALHCYPRLEDGLKEIRRVLKENGTFFATTFLTGALGTSSSFPIRRTSGFRLFSVEELTRLMEDAGFQQVDVRKEGSFCAVIKCVNSPTTTPKEEETTATEEPGAASSSGDGDDSSPMAPSPSD